MVYYKKVLGLVCLIFSIQHFSCPELSTFFCQQTFSLENPSLRPILKKRPVKKKQKIRTNKRGEKENSSLLLTFLRRLDSKTKGLERFNVKLEKKPQKRQWPVFPRIFKNFSKNTQGLVLLVKSGSAVYPVEKGIVVYTGSILMDYKKLVVIYHDDKHLSVYGYLENISVKNGQRVFLNTVIGHVKKSQGFEQLYLGVSDRKRMLDPKNYLP